MTLQIVLFFVREEICEVDMGELLHIGIVSVWGIGVVYEVGGFESWVQFFVIYLRKDCHVVWVKHVAILVRRDAQTSRLFRIVDVERLDDRVDQTLFGNTFIHFLHEVLHDNLFFSSGNIFWSEDFYEGEVTFSVSICSCEDVPLLESAIDINLIIYSLTDLSVSSSEMSIV